MQTSVRDPEAPYRVIGYDDLCSDFDLPFYSLVQAAKMYLELERNGMYVVFFIDKRTFGGSRRTRVEKRLEELKFA